MHEVSNILQGRHILIKSIIRFFVECYQVIVRVVRMFFEIVIDSNLFQVDLVSHLPKLSKHFLSVSLPLRQKFLLLPIIAVFERVTLLVVAIYQLRYLFHVRSRLVAYT